MGISALLFVATPVASSITYWKGHISGFLTDASVSGELGNEELRAFGKLDGKSSGCLNIGTGYGDDLYGTWATTSETRTASETLIVSIEGWESDNGDECVYQAGDDYYNWKQCWMTIRQGSESSEREFSCCHEGGGNFCTRVTYTWYKGVCEKTPGVCGPGTCNPGATHRDYTCSCDTNYSFNRASGTCEGIVCDGEPDWDGKQVVRLTYDQRAPCARATDGTCALTCNSGHVTSPTAGPLTLKCSHTGWEINNGCYADSCVVLAQNEPTWEELGVMRPKSLDGCDQADEGYCQPECAYGHVPAAQRPLLYCSLNGAGSASWQFQNPCLDSFSCADMRPLSFNDRMREMSAAANSDYPPVLRAVFVCIRTTEVFNADQRVHLLNVTRELVDNIANSSALAANEEMMKLRIQAAEFARGSWSPLSLYVPPFSPDYYQDYLEETIDQLTVVQARMDAGKAARDFTALFELEMSTNENQVADAEGVIQMYESSIAETESLLKRSYDAFVAIEATIADKVAELKESIVIAAALDLVKNVFTVVKGVVTCGMAVAATVATGGAAFPALMACESLGDIATGLAAIGTGSAELYRAMENMRDVYFAVSQAGDPASVPDWELIEQGKTGAEWDAMATAMEGELLPICDTTGSSVRFKCFDLLGTIKQTAIYGKDIFKNRLSILDFKKELDLATRRRANYISRTAPLQAAIDNSQLASNQALMQEVMADHIVTAFSLLRSYCLTLRYVYPDTFATEATSGYCYKIDGQGSSDGTITDVLSQLQALNAAKEDALLQARDSRGIGQNFADVMDITHKFDMARFVETKKQSFRIDVGELPALYRKKNVVLKEVRIFFEGVSTRQVSVDISLGPPFLKDTDNGVLAFDLAGISGHFDYRQGTSSCPLDKLTDNKWCVETTWDWDLESTFTNPTPFGHWHVALPNVPLKDMQQLTGVKLELVWHSQGTHALATTNYTVGDWGQCEECYQTRDVHCSSTINGEVHPQFLSFCEYNLGDLEPFYRSCGGADCDSQPPPELKEWLGGSQAVSRENLELSDGKATALISRLVIGSSSVLVLFLAW